jgi:hypothetical protein
MKSRRVLWAATAGLAALMSAVLVAQPASAHSPSTLKALSGASLCVDAYAQIIANHTTGELGGHSSTSAVFRNVDCAPWRRTRSVSGAGNIRVRYSLQRWDGSNWYTCRSTPFVLNTAGYLNVIASNSHGAAPCGRGHYRTLGQSLAWNGSAWEGGTIASPSHPPVP